MATPSAFPVLLGYRSKYASRNLRPALGDVTSVTVNITAEAGGDLKRQRMGNTGYVSDISSAALNG